MSPLLPDNNLKKNLCQVLAENLNNKIEELQESILALQESKLNETKSSAGDKYETGREMLQQEQDKNQAQLSNLIKQKHIIDKLNLTKKYEKVESGAMVVTNEGNYFLCVGGGKQVIEGSSYYAISPTSPLGQVLLNKQEGDTIHFQSKKFDIKLIY
jgi:transcription elongation GreA/GreB family factor